MVNLDYTRAQVCTRTGVCDDLIVQVFWLWCGNAVYHSILLFWMTVVALEQGRSDVITLHASCGAVYCNRSCLFVGLFVGVFVCVFVCGSVTTITRNCMH